jgi:F-type H+-transporting ATPase subunit b
MGTFFWLATEAGAAELAEAAEKSGFGFNFDILETNLINLAIVAALLVYFGRRFLGKILSERQAQIETEIKAAEQRQREAAEKLADEQQKLAQAQAEAERIRAAAAESAKAAREAILAQADQEIQRLKATAAQDSVSNQERAIAEIRQRVAVLALEQVESQIQSQLQSEDTQHQLVDRSIALLGGRP